MRVMEVTVASVFGEKEEFLEAVLMVVEEEREVASISFPTQT